MKTSPRGIAHIKKWEGFRSTPYRCTAGVLTIGYGTTQGVTPGMRITEAQADLLLEGYLRHLEKNLLAKLKVPVTQGQWDVLMSLGYNLGTTRLLTSQLWKKLNAGDFAGAAEEITTFRLVDGKIDRGLVNRRAEERTIFLTPIAKVNS